MPIGNAALDRPSALREDTKGAATAHGQTSEQMPMGTRLIRNAATPSATIRQAFMTQQKPQLRAPAPTALTMTATAQLTAVIPTAGEESAEW